MRAFEVHLNGKRLCVAGIGDSGVLNAMIDHVSIRDRNECYLRVGGLISPVHEHVRWNGKRLKTGDEVRVRIIEATSVDTPDDRTRQDPQEDVKRQKRYVREMARKFGWKIVVERKGS